MSKTKETSVLLVDPAAKTVVEGGMADGYAGIKRIFEARYQPDCCLLYLTHDLDFAASRRAAQKFTTKWMIPCFIATFRIKVVKRSVERIDNVMPRDIALDKPAELPGEDEFNRWPFKKTGGSVGDMMSRYGSLLSMIPVVGGGVAEGVKAIGKSLSEDTAQNQRDRLITHMRDATKKVVVLIDDLDRLDRDEIMTMLKMVRLSANFPNVIYLLAFDEERVGRVAGQAYGEAADGRQFLEKIIQYPFSLPAISSVRLASYVLRHAQAACQEAALIISDKQWGRNSTAFAETFFWFSLIRRARPSATRTRFDSRCRCSRAKLIHSTR